MITVISKKLLLASFIVAILSVTLGCTGNDKTKDAKEVAEDKNDAKVDNGTSEKDAQFLVNAAEINVEEISLGQLAQQKASMTHVKEMGKMMVDDHTKAMAALTELAKAKMIAIPTTATENAMDAYKKLNGEPAKDFDKDYSDMMVSGHKDAIAMFEKASVECKDADIKAWATATIPTLKAHLHHALMCQKESGKM